MDRYATRCPCECHGSTRPCNFEGGCHYLHEQLDRAAASVPRNPGSSAAGGGPRCYGCGGATSGDSARLCSECTDVLRTDLEEVPQLWEELETTRSRLDKIGGGGGARSGGAEIPLPIRPEAMRVADVLHTHLAAWCRDVAVARQVPLYDVPAEDAVACAAWLLARVETVRQLTAAAACLTEIREAVRLGWRTVDRRAAKVYAGPCDCGEDLYGFPRSRITACRECGLEYRTADRREWVLASLREHLATAAEIAAGIGELYGQEINRKTINQWHSRGRLVERTWTPDASPLFRIGDVLDLAMAGRTRGKAS